jgi:hypothetical protein
LALLLLAAAPSTPAHRSEQVIDLFVRICLKGEARFSKGEIEKVRQSTLPWPLNGMVEGVQGQAYRLRRPVDAYVSVVDGGRESRFYSRACRVSARHVDVEAAANRILAYLGQPPLPPTRNLTRYWQSYLDGGAKFEITRRGPYLVVLESFTLTPEGTERARQGPER